ncbi:hypothetical protein CEXT_668861 [Caerostris extrusa]|uniref:Uncharacterized protein n=1 Tax=Caerostris extrusa TaxID=172846 RepID=A0AAV4MRF9_CAEEX|nr:hypothetical protein CEXT_668861 [Caerostris extrusa]
MRIIHPEHTYCVPKGYLLRNRKLESSPSYEGVYKGPVQNPASHGSVKGGNLLNFHLLHPIRPRDVPVTKIGIDLLQRFPVTRSGNRLAIVFSDYLTR